MTTESPPGAVLVVKSGSENTGPISLEKNLHILGREPFADIGFDNPFVSRKHAEIRYSAADYSIRDLGSKNGTFVDGVQIGNEPKRLVGGEIVELGQGQVVTTFALTSQTITLQAVYSKAGTETAKDAALIVDVSQREVYLHGSPISPPLSRKEFDVIALLHERSGQACSKDDIAAYGWPEREEGGVSDQEIGQCIHRIRRRVEPDPSAPIYVELVRGYGYRLNPNG